MSRPASKTRPDVVITGAGLVCALGLDRETAWRAVNRGRSGIALLTAVESPVPVGTTGGQAPDLTSALRPESREVVYLRHAMQAALRDAAVSGAPPYSPPRCGIVLGTTLHGMRSGGRFLRTRDPEALSGFLAANVLQQAAAGLDFSGFSATVCSACSSGLASIAMAVTLLRAGQLDLVLAGGYDPISEYALGGFGSMRLVTDDRIRPFGRDRFGMKLGEGYGVVVLERTSDAAARLATPLAAIAGSGEACDVHHLSKPHPEGHGALRAIQQALAAAGLVPGEIDMIAAHCTGTPDNDAAEYAALAQAFPDALPTIPVVAFKTHLGHTLGGAGAVELILSACALRDGVVPPCADASADEVEFPRLQLATGTARSASPRHTLNNSLGFGGANTCMVLSRPDWAVPAQVEQASAAVVRAEDDVWITGLGVVLPNAVGGEAFLALLDDRGSPSLSDTCGMDSMPIDDLVSARRVRRMSDYAKLTLAATTLAYRDAGIENVEAFGEGTAAVLATTHGSATYCHRYYEQLVSEGIAAANPLLFAEGVPNAAAAHVSTMMSIRGFCQTVIGTRTAGLDAMFLAAERLRTGAWTSAVICAAEEYSDVIHRVHVHVGLSRPAAVDPGRRKAPGFVTGAGAVSLILERADAARRRGAAVRARITAVAGGRASVDGPKGIAETVRRIIDDLHHPPHVVTSANATWLSRAELAGIRIADRHRPEPTTISAIYGHIGECFSANALSGLAAAIIRGRPPAWRAGWSGKACVATGQESATDVGVIASDYSGSVTGVRIEVLDLRQPP